MNNEYEQNQEIEFQNALKAIKDFDDAFSKLDNQRKNKLFEDVCAIAIAKNYINTSYDIYKIIEMFKRVEKELRKSTSGK